MIERLKNFLRPDKEKLKIFALIAPAAIVILFVSFSIMAHLDSPSISNPISKMVPEEFWTNPLFILIELFFYMLAIILTFPAMFIAVLFTFLPIPYAGSIAFILLELGYLYVISCTTRALINRMRGKN